MAWSKIGTLMTIITSKMHILQNKEGKVLWLKYSWNLHIPWWSIWFKSLLLYFQGKCSVYSKRQQARQLMPSTLATQVEIWAPGFGLVQPWLLKHLGSEPRAEDLSFSRSSSIISISHYLCFSVSVTLWEKKMKVNILMETHLENKKDWRYIIWVATLEK